ncbi:MAG: DUF1592 domain-containing protein [Planctomycetota bacterium]
MALVSPHSPKIAAPLGRRILPIVLGSAFLGTTLSDPPGGPSHQSNPTEPESAARSARGLVAPDLIDEYCGHCHSGRRPDGDLDLVGWATGEDPGSRPEIAREVRSVLLLGAMPPADEPQPSTDERREVLDWVKGLLRTAEDGGAGRVTMRRLSRFEYERSVEDLCFAKPPVDRLPADAAGYGFDNIGDAASFSVLHLDAFASVADEVLATALPEPFEPIARRIEAERCPTSMERGRGADVLTLLSNGTVGDRFEVPEAGTYELRVRLWAKQAGPDFARTQLRFGRARADIAIEAPTGEPVVVRMRRRLEPGRALFQAAFTNDYYRPDHEDPSQRDRNLYVDWFEIEGPFEPRPATELESWLSERVIDLRVDEHVRDTELADRFRPAIRDFGSRAFRRPVAPAELTRLTGIAIESVRAGESFSSGLRDAFRAILCSPNFLFRVEPGGFRRPGQRDESEERLEGYALASRLSYFLWSTVPDERLQALAADGSIHEPRVLRSAARRMLRDRRAKALSENFAMQWLDLRRLESLDPDPERFPEFDEGLVASMRTETLLAFDDLRRGDLPLRSILDRPTSWLDARLAQFYGVSFPARTDPDAFVEVGVPAIRRGLLGHSSVLATTSEPTRTSPVKRGRWILDVLLDAAPPPPPPGSDSFEGGESSVGTPQSQREALARHRGRSECAVCHDRLDPFGLALEGFDPIGRERSSEDGHPIETTATLPDGRRLDGLESVRSVLLEQSEFVPALARRLFVYAVGRPATIADLSTLDGLLAEGTGATTLEDLVLWIVTSNAFRSRTRVRQD